MCSESVQIGTIKVGQVTVISRTDYNLETTWSVFDALSQPTWHLCATDGNICTKEQLFRFNTHFLRTKKDRLLITFMDVTTIEWPKWFHVIHTSVRRQTTQAYQFERVDMHTAGRSVIRQQKFNSKLVPAMPARIVYVRKATLNGPPQVWQQ